MKLSNATTGERLRELRLIANLTPETAAAKAGITVDELTAYENDTRTPAAETASFLRDLYDGAFIGETGVCCLCGGKYIKGGNNPFPLCADHETGRCCDRCDRETVQPARALFATGKLTREEVQLVIDYRDLPSENNKIANRKAFRELAKKHRAELLEQAAEVTRDA